MAGLGDMGTRRQGETADRFINFVLSPCPPSRDRSPSPNFTGKSLIRTVLPPYQSVIDLDEIISLLPSLVCSVFPLTCSQNVRT